MTGESLTNRDSLPDDVVFAILVQFPPLDLHNEARLVCRQWYRIINSPDFIHENFQHSPPGLLILNQTRHSAFVAMQQGQITISELNYKFHSPAMGSCNGFLVEVEPNPIGGKSNPSIYVVNPVTGRRYALPPISLKGVIDPCAVMAYAAASREYKVVLTYSYSCHRVTKVQRCAILTVGVDRDWRHISTKHLYLTATEFFNSSPLIVGGFIYWTDIRGTRVLTLNVETEVSTSTPVPKGYEKRLKYYLSTGTCLTMVVPWSKLSWEVWELKQAESGEWIWIFEIDLGDQKRRLQELVAKCSGINYGSINIEILEPVGWLNYGEVLVLRSSYLSRVCVLYNVRTQQIDSSEIKHSFSFSSFLFHRNSLYI